MTQPAGDYDAYLVARALKMASADTIDGMRDVLAEMKSNMADGDAAVVHAAFLGRLQSITGELARGYQRQCAAIDELTGDLAASRANNRQLADELAASRETAGQLMDQIGRGLAR